MESKKALVLGCYGQDGSLICKSLLEKGYKVIGLAKAKINNNQRHVELNIQDDLEIVEADLRDLSTLTEVFNSNIPDEIYNFAAQSSVGLSFEKPIATIESIVNGTLNILEIARHSSFDGKLFFAGSSEMFGDTQIRATITHSQNPKSPYAIAKQASYNLVKLYRNIYNIKCVTGILFSHESPYRNKNFITQKIVNGAIKCSTNKKTQIRIGNMNVFRDWGWAAEYVEAMQLMLKAETMKDQIICTGELNSLEEFIKLTFEKLNLNYKDHITSEEILFRKTDIKYSCGDPEPITKDLKWKAKFHMNEVIDKLLEYQIKNN